MADIHKLQQPSISGRIGTGLGNYLAESIPKEVERSRLSSGLKELNQKKNLTPFERFSELLAVPGLANNPQALESASRLLEKQSLGNAYANINTGGGDSGDFNQQPGTIAPENLSRQPQQQPQVSRGQIQQTPHVKAGEPLGTSQINPTNTTVEKYVPVLPWSAQRVQREVGKFLKNNPQLVQENPEGARKQAEAYVADLEKRYLEMPAAERAIADHKEHVRNVIENKYENSVAEKLQKKAGKPGEREIYKDISGEQFNDLKRGLENDLSNNPEESENDIINDWSDRALKLAKTNARLQTLSAKGTLERAFENEPTYKKLLEFRDAYADANSSETYYNKLIAKQSDGGMELSPQAAASIAYKTSPQATSFIKSKQNHKMLSSPRGSGKLATELLDHISGDDSVLALAYYFKDHYPNFSDAYFFDALRENRDRLSPKQQDELQTGASNLIPNWADIVIMPATAGRLK